MHAFMNMYTSTHMYVRTVKEAMNLKEIRRGVLYIGTLQEKKRQKEGYIFGRKDQATFDTLKTTIEGSNYAICTTLWKTCNIGSVVNVGCDCSYHMRSRYTLPTHKVSGSDMKISYTCPTQ